MKAIVRSYLETALWSSTDPDNGDDPLDRAYTVYDFAPEAVTSAVSDLAQFIDRAGAWVDGEDACQIAHDFWLTRNRHGAGFWDGNYETEQGKALTELAHSFGECGAYVGDDGKVYFS